MPIGVSRTNTAAGITVIATDFESVAVPVLFASADRAPVRLPPMTICAFPWLTAAVMGGLKNSSAGRPPRCVEWYALLSPHDDSPGSSSTSADSSARRVYNFVNETSGGKLGDD